MSDFLLHLMVKGCSGGFGMTLVSSCLHLLIHNNQIMFLFHILLFKVIWDVILDRALILRETRNVTNMRI